MDEAKVTCGVQHAPWGLFGRCEKLLRNETLERHFFDPALAHVMSTSVFCLLDAQLPPIQIHPKVKSSVSRTSSSPSFGKPFRLVSLFHNLDAGPHQATGVRFTPCALPTSEAAVRVIIETPKQRVGRVANKNNTSMCLTNYKTNKVKAYNPSSPSSESEFPSEGGLLLFT